MQCAQFLGCAQGAGHRYEMAGSRSGEFVVPIVLDWTPRPRRARSSCGGFRSLPSDRERLEALERWFRSQPFRYSLRPGSVTDLDAFLFDRQVGFCGHYASAVAALMRSADVPARVVSGYLGGVQVQPIGGSAYLDLRQSDAHAWVEVWLEGSGWQQVDPTLWIDRSAGNGSSEPAGVNGLVLSKRNWWLWLQRF